MLVPTTHVTLITAHWVPAPSGATMKAQPPRGGHPTRGLRQRRLVGPRGHQGFHLLSGQLHSSCSTPMWHQGLGLVGMRILWLSKECATKLNRDQSIQPQMLKDKGKNNLGEQKTSCKTTRSVVRQRKSGQVSTGGNTRLHLGQGGRPKSTDLECGEVDEDMSVQAAWPQQSIVQNVSSVGGCQDDDMVSGAHS